MRAKVEAAGLRGRIEVDSAGTGSWHQGSAPDERAIGEALRRGIELTSRARQVHAGDFAYFDLLVAMDHANEADLLDLAPTAADRTKVRLLRQWDPHAHEHAVALDVPDPYYGGPSGFADMFDLIDAACAGLLQHTLAALDR